MKASIPSSELWMRPVSFAGLHRILHILAEYPKGLTPGELDSLIREGGSYLTARGSAPKRTTLYHCRNTLLRIEAVRRNAKRLVVNDAIPEVQGLLRQTPRGDSSLPPLACDLFAGLALRNPDCKRHFFDLFMPRAGTYGPDDFRSEGHSVAWRSQTGDDSAAVVLQAAEDGASMQLRSPSEVKSILHGVRYWARDQLKLIDELFRENDGAVMYPVRNPSIEASPREVIQEIIDMVDAAQEWTMLSIRDLLRECCERARRPLKEVFAALRWLAVSCSGELVMVPTSRSMAVLTARSRQSEELRLRSYFHDAQGRYISHVRLHRSIRRGCNVQHLQ